jgi:hypothetical protein
VEARTSVTTLKTCCGAVKINSVRDRPPLRAGLHDAGHNAPARSSQTNGLGVTSVQIGATPVAFSKSGLCIRIRLAGPLISPQGDVRTNQP